MAGTHRARSGTLHRFCADEAGTIEAVSYILMTAIVALGMILSLSTFRNTVTQGFGDISDAVDTVNQTYTVTMTFAQIGGGTTTTTFGYIDTPASLTQTAGDAPAGMDLLIPPASE
jgi:Flp pilus assembly pilin Flp